MTPPARSGSHFLLVFALLASFMGTSVGMAQVTASLYAVTLGSSKTMLGLIAGAQSVGVVLVSLPIGMLVDRVGPALGARAISWLGYAWTYRLIAAAFLVTLLLSPIVFLRYTRPPALAETQKAPVLITKLSQGAVISLAEVVAFLDGDGAGALHARLL